MEPDAPPAFLINAEIKEAMVDVLNVEKGVTRDSQEKVRESSMCISLKPSDRE